MSWNEYGGYESAAMIKKRIAREIAKRRKGGQAFVPVECQVARGVPAKTFWGKAWCTNLESYSDYESRLPRGRTYLRKGNVYDLSIEEGAVFAYVAGSEIYEVEISIEVLEESRWEVLKQAVAGEVRNLVDLLSGELGDGVMQAVTDPESGLFPAPSEIRLSCNCPDWADVCKHVAAVMYAIGVQLDASPELFFKLRKVDHAELIQAATTAGPNLASGDSSAEVLVADELAELFGIDLADPESAFGSS
ncbi:hypothetical protein Poly30_52740 [Planctomycetes bacterium Poly30]|uniref:SWIM-type domain-containing protein n=1 Tax=Saltatorellus ferox TaxID=2528018 RepID=A0A518F055_9BACT|nr:hypothetical protein Poly30_52740 [Planctomycetes bacterium Poly30]